MSEADSEAQSNRIAFLEDLKRWGPNRSKAGVLSSSAAQEYCRQLARRHYENFSIASWLVPKELRQHLYNIYAYCRWSDDLADEVADSTTSLELLDWWEAEFRRMDDGKCEHPVMIALSDTRSKYEISDQPFLDLIGAFRKDQSVRRYETDEDLVEYCRQSANPVGRMLLAMAGVKDERCLKWSDSICTGLQLANFCQDMRRDALMDRIYLPRSRWPEFGLTESEILKAQGTESLRRTLQHWVDDTRPFFEVARRLAVRMPSWLSRDILLFAGGGCAILDAIERSRFDVWKERVSVGAFQKAKLAGMAFFVPSHHGIEATDRVELQESLDSCRSIAKRSGSNFYRSFSLLRPDRRNAMTTLYAFARCVDDVSDEAGEADLKRARLNSWKKWIERLDSNANTGSRETNSTQDAGMVEKDCREEGWSPVDRARRESLEPAMIYLIQEFGVSVSWLGELIDGVEMDLDANLRFRSIEQLRDYCYHVASTVGLACLKIWGAEIDRVHSAAIECGMAFQWTNILRDVAEDARRGRIYLPADQFAKYGIGETEWLAGAPNGDWRGMMREEISRARSSYEQAWSIHEALTGDGQRMFSLMWRTYRQLLEQIESQLDQVWTSRIEVPRRRKIVSAFHHSLALLYRRLDDPLPSKERYSP